MGVQKTTLFPEYIKNQIARHTKEVVGEFYKGASSSNEEIKRAEKAIREIASKLFITGASVDLKSTEFSINMQVYLSSEVLNLLGLSTKVEYAFKQYGTLFNFYSEKVCRITSHEDVIWV